MRSYLFSSFEGTLHDTKENTVCVLGDLFDNFDVEARDWLQAFLVLQDWLVRPNGRQMHTLVLVAGNHDLSPKALRVSAFEMLAKVLVEQFGPKQVVVIGIDQWSVVDDDTVALAHCSNQDTFDAKLKEVLALAKAGDRVLLHTNYDNGFAAVSDHSLNVSREQAKEFKDKGAFLYFAHEHQAREAFSGHVVVFGNQWPSSVSDCLNNDQKFMHVMTDAGVEKVGTWSRKPSGYAEIEWRNLGMWHESGQDPDFIRVTGTATASEAGECISTIAKFRTKSQAFVITNGVKIEGIAENSDLPEAFEATKAFDVLSFINENLDEPQRVAVAKLQGVIT